MDVTLIVVLVVAIVALSCVAGWIRLRQDPGKARGALPRKGHHELTSDYQSGLGGHSTSWKVPADPQEYAKHFVPHNKR